MALDIGTGVRSNILALLIKVTPQDPNDRDWKWNMDHVIKLEKDLPVLKTDFNRVKGLLIHIINQFQARQKRLPEPAKGCLGRIGASLREAIHLIDDAKRQQDRRGCIPRRREGGASSKNRVWKARFDALLQELQTVFSISSNSEQNVSSAARLLQPVPDSGFVGSGVQSNREKLQKWLSETSREARVIGVYGTTGVGKTSLLKIIYNSYKKEVSRFFDVVIWFTMSRNFGSEQRNFENEQLQASIAKALNLSLEETATAETKKKIGDDNGGKLLISSRNRDVIDKMGAKRDYSLEIETLSEEDSWHLFRRGAFENGVVPEKIGEDIARKIATNCKGLPLDINAVAVAMKSKEESQLKWNDAFNLMINKILPS